jgi:hypothetical protein
MSTPSRPMADPPVPAAVGAVADLYLGNILFAIERCAMALEAEERLDEAAFYRGIGRKLADARATDRATEASRIAMTEASQCAMTEASPRGMTDRATG